MTSISVHMLRGTTKALARVFAGDTPKISITPLAIGSIPARLYTPPGSEECPPIVFFHGGGFIACGLDTHDALCRQLAVVSGLRVLAVGYRLAPEHSAPAQVEDAITACRWVLNGSNSLSGHSNQIFVAGDSAGGYLALRCCVELNMDGQKILGQLLFYPLIGMGTDMSLPWLARMVIGGMQSQIGQVSYPALTSQDLERLPQTLIISGRALDPVHRDNATFTTELQAAGIAADHVVFPHLFHGGLNMSGLSRSAVRAVELAGKTIADWRR